MIVTRLLMSSDPRLRQLFQSHGTEQLLMAMTFYTSGLLKQEVAATLAATSKCGYKTLVWGFCQSPL